MPIESDRQALSQVTAEMSKIVDEVELQWLNPIAENIIHQCEPTSIIAPVVDKIESPSRIVQQFEMATAGEIFPSNS